MTRGSPIPEEIELMVNELVRTRHANHVLLTGFAFVMKGTPGDFIFHFGTIDDSYDNIQYLHDTLISALSRKNPEKTILRKNDA
jgi:hypothetical protein